MLHLAGFAFQSTLSLRRATRPPPRQPGAGRISIHALLAESDHADGLIHSLRQDFNPRSPCGERPGGSSLVPTAKTFQSTLSLRRATSAQQIYMQLMQISIHALLAESDISVSPVSDPAALISIHALLAESDCSPGLGREAPGDFNPRSPCGERLHLRDRVFHCVKISIHALLAESDWCWWRGCNWCHNFNPRSPCGERR